MQDTPDNVIETAQLSLHIGTRRDQLLDSVSLQIKAGERIAIVGANGAGKTTLLRCLLGFIPHHEGNIRIMGKPLSSLTRREIACTISYVPQQLSQNIPFTVLEFIIMSRYAQDTGIVTQNQQDETMARNAMERTGICHLENQPMATLSGGERQKVSIAAALARQTPILILDEPSAHLDPKQRESIQELIGHIGRKSHTTILTVTHDLNWAAMDFDRILGMSEGRVLADNTPEKFMTTETLHQLFNATWTIQAHPQNGCPVILPSHHTSTSR